VGSTLPIVQTGTPLETEELDPDPDPDPECPPELSGGDPQAASATHINNTQPARTLPDGRFENM